MIAIKGMEMQADCKKCPLMGAKGNPKDPFSPMMCVAIWAIKHEVKYCIAGKIRDDCPLVEIVTCKDCKHNYENTCDFDGYGVDDDYFCKNGERRE